MRFALMSEINLIESYERLTSSPARNGYISFRRSRQYGCSNMMSSRSSINYLLLTAESNGKIIYRYRSPQLIISQFPALTRQTDKLIDAERVLSLSRRIIYFYILKTLRDRVRGNYLLPLHLLDVVISVRFNAQSSCFPTKRNLLKGDSLKGQVDVVSL